MLEGCDGVVWKDHVRNCAPCHLPNVDGIVDPSLAVLRKVGIRKALPTSSTIEGCIACRRCIGLPGS
ncbi:unnamed protein product [Sphagnum troendelagicum]